MIAITEAPFSPARKERCRSWKEHRRSWPSGTAQTYRHVVVAIVFFFLAQLLTCAWDQPFWAHNIDFPGQIVAMVFVWLAMWTVQGVFFKPGEGLERFYHWYLKAPVSFEARSTYFLTTVNDADVVISPLYRPRFSTSTCPSASQCHS